MRLEHDLLDHLTLEDPEIGRGWRRLRPPRVQREVVGGDEATFAEDRGPLEHVAQLAHVPRPVVSEERGLRLFGQARGGKGQRTADVLQEGAGEMREVVLPLAQRRDPEPAHTQALVEALAELSSRTTPAAA